jgi:hypothetical protein
MILENVYLFVIIILLVISYGFPKQVSGLFRNPIVRLAFLSLLTVVSYENNPLTVLLIGMLYMLIMIQIGDEEDVSQLVAVSAMKKLEQEKNEIKA